MHIYNSNPKYSASLGNPDAILSQPVVNIKITVEKIMPITSLAQCEQNIALEYVIYTRC